MAHVLIVDDEKNIRNTVQTALTADGHRVEVAGNAADALQKFGDGASWDLVLTDQRMPGMQGSELAEEIRLRDPDARVVMMTAYATPGLVVQMLEVGASDFLPKPFGLPALRRAVRSALARPAHEHPPEVSLSHSAADISFAVNGFRFFSDEARTDLLLPPGIGLARAFRVVGPDGEAFRTVVGLTPNLHDEICREIGYDYTPDAAVWDYLCEQTLSYYLWQHGEAAPPDVLPLYQIPHEWLAKVQRFCSGEN